MQALPAARRHLVLAPRRLPRTAHRAMTIATATASPGAAAAAGQPPKQEGDISDAFASLAGVAPEPLPERFRELKRGLVPPGPGRERFVAAWDRLLARLAEENEVVAREGPAVVPSLDFRTLGEDLGRLRSEIRKRGVAVVRGVIPEAEARAYKDEVEAYVARNPWTRAFPKDNPQVYELYWSAPQMKARLHPNFLHVQRTLMSGLWSCASSSSSSAGATAGATISLSQPMLYADRLRIRQPGDAQFALGPHMDGGSVERWERHGYGLGGVYDAVFAGEWDNEGGGESGGGFDPFDAAARVPAVTSNYGGLGPCSAFRMFQGWVSLSRTGPREGTLMVNPLLRLATAYLLMRPFFRPVRPEAELASRAEYLAPANWRFADADDMTSELHGATPGRGQELSPDWHPHLDLDRTMVHVPQVNPGDYVVWHCDTIHAVDKVHAGTSDSSVLYVPICPTTELNARYLARQRQAFLAGTPSPDFPGGEGESRHQGRPTEADLRAGGGGGIVHPVGLVGLRSLGLEPLEAEADDSEGARRAVQRANEILGF